MNSYHWKSASKPPLALYFVWIRIHKAHKVTRAMAAGLTDRLMDMKDIATRNEDAAMRPRLAYHNQTETLPARPRNGQADQSWRIESKFQLDSGGFSPTRIVVSLTK